MHFCSNCDNMYYLKIQEEENRLVHYCRNCGTEDTTLPTNNISINNRVTSQGIRLNEFTKFDNTLPRTKTMKCPNQSCISNTENGIKEILYVRYDDANMKYVYMCTACDTSWKQ